MPKLLSHPKVWKEVCEGNSGLRGRLKAHLDRLEADQVERLRIEKVNGAPKLRELKISWDKQEFRFLFFRTTDGHYCLVEFFNKKGRKLPTARIDSATARMKDIEFARATPVAAVLH